MGNYSGGIIRAGLLIAAAALLASASASAATTLGTTYPNPGQGAVNCTGDKTLIQTTSSPVAYAASFDGVITSWSVEDFFPTTVKLKVARLGGGSSFTVVGEDGPRSIPENQLSTFPVRIPVRQGDTIGLWIPAGGYYCPIHSAGNAYRRLNGDPAPGEASSFSETVDGGYLPVSARLERDRDRDGYGDETQDECPTNASTQDACSLPAVLGETFTPVPSNYCNGATAVVKSSPGVVHTAPADGVITSWSYQAGTLVSGTAKLKILRPQGGDSYLAVGENGPQAPTANVLNTWATRVPVRRGDKIGLRAQGIGCASNGADWGLGFFDGDIAPGSSGLFTDAGSRRLDVSAVLEGDADNDGYGDTSQDLCPTDATTQGKCPVTRPPDDGACAKAKKKRKMAKAKLKKLKKKDAKAKKVKAAKKKVTKAQSAVKKAC